MADAIGETLRPSPKTLDYDETLMYGRYTKELGEFAKNEAEKIRSKEVKKKKVHDEGDGLKHYTRIPLTRWKKRLVWCWGQILHRLGEDWLFLTVLGIVMALLSFAMDYLIEIFQHARIWLYEELTFSVAAQFSAWIIFPLVFICFSTGFVHIVGPNAIGSGIPEMKTIMRGVVLKEYLTLRTLISKSVGLCTSLGCGLPIGKEGPFVHVASIAATLLGKVFFRDLDERGDRLYSSESDVCILKILKTKVNSRTVNNQSRNSEMLAAACAVGVACTFAAPIGGVLFSIEVTSTFFAVRNYWRGFYSAVCGAVVFRMLAIWFKNEETLTALFKTNFRQDFPFDPAELFAFSIIGVVCGFAGALFVYTHRKFVEFIRKQKKVTKFLQRNRFIFPSVVAVLLSALMFPPGLGQFMAGELTNHQAVNELFSNFTWALGDPDTVQQAEILHHWSGPLDNIYITLSLFIIMRFWMSALATTLPVPAGVFIPVFTMGAAFGRLMGEGMAVWFPHGFNGNLVLPGGYAIVGAAALSGSVTHTISTSVIVFELTGQMGHVLPCVIAVLISNAIGHVLQPSFYDSLIQIKRLPFLPDMINPNSINAYQVFVEDFMVKDVIFLSLTSTYHQIQNQLNRYKYRSFPLVESKGTMVLLGSIQRQELDRILQLQLTRDMTSDLRGEQRATNHRVDQIRWESFQLQKKVNYDQCHIDPSPFQLVEKTSLYKVHSLFSLLSLHHAYVTNTGRLVGIVGMKEVREAIQGHMLGELPRCTTTSAAPLPTRSTQPSHSIPEITLTNEAGDTQTSTA